MGARYIRGNRVRRRPLVIGSFVLIFVIFYFLLILPQQKRAEAAEGFAGGPEEGRQGGHGVGYLGDRDESREERR